MHSLLSFCMDNWLIALPSSFQSDKRVSFGIKLWMFFETRVSYLLTFSSSTNTLVSNLFSSSLSVYYHFTDILLYHYTLEAWKKQKEKCQQQKMSIKEGSKESVFFVVVELDTSPHSVMQLLSLVERKIDLVYGGGSVGLMGLISQTVLNGGCHVLGVIPKALLPHEISGETFGEVKTVANMHERKSIMAEHADAFIALPGGYGTMEELMEVITWSQLGIHDKPIGMLNVDGYFNGLLSLFDKAVEEGFIENSARNIMVTADTAAELIQKMEEYVPIHDKVAQRQSWEGDQLLEPTQSGETLGP